MPRSVHEHDPNLDDSAEQGLIDAFKLGRELQEFCDTSEAGRHLVTTANDQLQEAINDWMREDDAKSQKAADAHFRARVALGIRVMIESAITAGREAEATLAENEASGSP